MYVVGKEIKQVTRDHSLVEEMVRMGEIAKDAAKDHPDKNIITRAVGAADKVVADFFQVNLEPQDYILICTDGLTNMVEDQDIRSIINSQRDVAECAERLVRTANDNGGKDNITVVVIEPFSDEVERMLTEGMFIDDRYEIVGKIGAGGMSDVYKAKDHTLGRFVAIKVLKQEFSEDVNFVTKFRTEAQSAAGLEHPNIVNIYDVGSRGGDVLHYHGICRRHYLKDLY